MVQPGIAGIKLGSHYKPMDEWERLFCGKNFVTKLHSKSLSGNLTSNYFRSICWRVFWDCLSENVDHWKDEVTEKRNLYTNLRKKYIINPHNELKSTDLDKHHPLSLAEDSIWNKYFQDTELRAVIVQDLDRLYPELDFFQEEKVQSYLLHILFCYARENPHVSYKQGMHEVLAPLVFVIVTNCKNVAESAKDVTEEIKYLLDINYVEHDAYYLFHNIMESIQGWYVNLRTMEDSNQFLQNQKEMFQDPSSTIPVNAISNKLHRIQEQMLHRFDPLLCRHLREINVTPQVYGIRWVRLLFGREFALNDLLILWDAIFASGMGMELVEYIYLAMLIHIRDLLLKNDTSGCFALLMKYPETDSNYILERAIALKQRKSTNSRPSTMERKAPSTPLDRPKPHPVKYRLGESKEQMYAQALGSGSTTNKPIQKKSPKPRFHINTDHADGSPQTASVVHAQFVNSGNTAETTETTEKNKKTAVVSHVSNIRERVESTTQFISRLPNTLLGGKFHPNSSSMVSAVVEDHARLQRQVSDLQSELDRANGVFGYCASKMDVYMSLINERLFKEEHFADELTILGLTGIKQQSGIARWLAPQPWVLNMRGGNPWWLRRVQEILKIKNIDEVDFSGIDDHIVKARNKITAKEETPVGMIANFQHFANEQNPCDGVNTSLQDSESVTIQDQTVENDPSKLQDISHHESSTCLHEAVDDPLFQFPSNS